MKNAFGLTARLVTAALVLVVALVTANVTFVLAERRAMLRTELEEITESVAHELLTEYEDYLAGIIASASNYATNTSSYRDAVIGFDGSYDARIAVYNALGNLQAGFPAITNSYVLLPGAVLTFRSSSGEFADPERFPVHEIASQMDPDVSIQIVHGRTIVRVGVETIVSTLLFRPFRALGRHDVVLIADISQSALWRELRERIPVLSRFSVTESVPSELATDEMQKDMITARVVSQTFDRAFVVTLRDAGVIDRQENATFLIGSIVTAMGLFLVVARILQRQLSPLDKELKRLAARPSDPASLAEAVRVVTRDNEQLRSRYERVLPHYRRRVMNHLLLGLLTDGETLKERLAFTGTELPAAPFAALCVLVVEAEKSDRESASLVLLIASALEVEIGRKTADLLGPVDAMRYGTVISDDAKQQLDAVLARLPETARDRVYFGVGHSVEDPGELASSYDTAKRALAFRRVIGRRVFDPEHISATLGDDPAYPFALERDLMQAVRRRDEEHATEYLDSIFRELRARGDAVRGLEYLRVELLHVLEERLAASGASPAVLDSALDRYPLEDANSPEAMLSLFLQLVHRAIHEGEATGRGEYQVERFLRYIDENHADSTLQLLTLEEEFGLSRYYIGRRIKEETGEHFNEHLNRARVAHGVRLLESEPTLPIGDVAARIGYSYHYYFARQFRRIHGVTPSEYRDRVI